MKHPDAVVVDTRDGYTFFRDGDGELFTVESARLFTTTRNAGEWPGHQGCYKVYTLTEDGEA